MNQSEVIGATETYVRKTLKDDSTGHDWWHIHRVRNTTLAIAREEKADIFVAELGALLHDIADWKFHDGDLSVGPRKARLWLESRQVPEYIVAAVEYIVGNVSFKGASVVTPMCTLEGKCVQDADRLDATGAIGIARCFAYGGSKQRPLYNPEVAATIHADFEAYKNSQSSSVHHFYEKLLLLKDRMNTVTGKKLAEQCHAFLEQYLEQFHKEWNGEA